MAGLTHACSTWKHIRSKDASSSSGRFKIKRLKTAWGLTWWVVRVGMPGKVFKNFFVGCIFIGKSPLSFGTHDGCDFWRRWRRRSHDGGEGIKESWRVKTQADEPWEIHNTVIMSANASTWWVTLHTCIVTHLTQPHVDSNQTLAVPQDLSWLFVYHPSNAYPEGGQKNQSNDSETCTRLQLNGLLMVNRIAPRLIEISKSANPYKSYRQSLVNLFPSLTIESLRCISPFWPNSNDPSR